MLFDKKTYFYFDESGSPSVLGHRGKNLLNIGNTSKNFMVGYIKTENPHELSVNLENLRLQLLKDEYLQSVPSVRNLKNGFHANKDCLEVREKVFKLLKKSDFEAKVVVARKSVELFRNKFALNNKNLYKFLVSELLKSSAPQYENIDIYFSVMGNIVNIQNMTEALDSAIREFGDDKKNNNIRLFLQKPSQIPLLQVADYILWAVFQVFEHKDFRYYNFLKEKFNSVHDIFDGKGDEGTFYNKMNQLEVKKLSPDSGLGF